MAKEMAKLFVTLGIDDKEFIAGINNMQKTLTQAGKMMTGIGLAITASLGLAVKAGEEERINMMHLASVLDNVGVSYDEVSGSLEKYLTTLQRATGVADNEQRDVLSRLVLVTHDYNNALSLLPTVLDLAAAGQMDATTAATYLAKAYEDLQNGADKVSIRFGQASLQFKSLAEIQERVAGSAEKMASPFAILEKTFGDLQEKIGMALLPAITRIVEMVVPVIERIGDWIDRNPELATTLLEIAAAVGVVLTVVGPLLMMLPFISAGLTMMLGPAGLVMLAVIGIAAAIAALIIYWDDIVAFFKNIGSAIVDAFTHPLETIKTVFRAIANFVINGILGMVNNFVNIFVDAINGLISLINLLPGVDLGKLERISLHYEIPEFDSGGINLKPGMFYSGVPEAHIPLNSLGNMGLGGAGAIGSPTINITMQGSYIAERDLAQVVRDEFYKIKGRNYNLGFTQ